MHFNALHLGSSCKKLSRSLTTVCLTIGVLALASPGVSRADVMTFTAIGSGATDQGNNGSFDVLTPTSFATGFFDVFLESFRFALEFDISALPSGATGLSATLRLRTGRSDLAGQTTLAGYIGDGTITLSDMTAGLDILTFTPPNNGGNFYDVTSFIQGLYGSGDTEAGFNARQNPLGTTSAFWDGTGNSVFPLLTINFTPAQTEVPAPATLALLGLGLAGLGFSRRGSKKS